MLVCDKNTKNKKVMGRSLVKFLYMYIILNRKLLEGIFCQLVFCALNKNQERFEMPKDRYKLKMGDIFYEYIGCWLWENRFPLG